MIQLLTVSLCYMRGPSLCLECCQLVGLTLVRVQTNESAVVLLCFTLPVTFREMSRQFDPVDERLRQVIVLLNSLDSRVFHAHYPLSFIKHMTCCALF